MNEAALLLCEPCTRSSPARAEIRLHPFPASNLRASCANCGRLQVGTGMPPMWDVETYLEELPHKFMENREGEKMAPRLRLLPGLLQ